MPKTALFQTNLCIDRHYRRRKENRETDIDEFIKHDMTFIMEYTHTKNYMSQEASVEIRIVSIDNRIEDCGCCNSSECDSSDEELTDIYLMQCILKTEEPIFICLSDAILGGPITLRTESGIIATGSVINIMDDYKDYRPRLVCETR